MTYKRPIESPHIDPHPSTGPRNWVWLGAALLVVFAILTVLLYQNYGDAPGEPEETTLSADREAALQRVLDDHADGLLPYDESWEIALRDGDYTRARRELESLLSNSLQMAHFSRHCYFLGILYLYAPAPDRNLDRAIEYLRIGRQYRADANVFLAQAYVEAGQPEKARQLVEDNPGLGEQLPEEVRKKM